MDDIGGHSVDDIGGHSEKPPKTAVFPTIKRGWIEWRKRGARRYAFRRRWLRDDDGNGWIKSTPVRLKSIPPHTEDEYKRIKRLEKIVKSLAK